MKNAGLYDTLGKTYFDEMGGYCIMKCVKCGHEIMEGNMFCSYCGETVAQKNPGEEKPIYQTEIKKMLKTGKLVVYRDRAELITSSVQKTIFNYSSLISVKKAIDHIVFITGDGQKESCPVGMKNIHEAFVYIEKASSPYIEARKKRLLSEGIRYSVVSSMGMTSGILNILEDRAEFKARSGQSETVFFKEVKFVCASMGNLDFSLIDGKIRSFSVSRELRDEILAFVEEAVEPYIAERKRTLLERGIYYSCQESGRGTLNVLKDRVEYTAVSGQKEEVSFEKIRAVSLYDGRLELSMTDGKTKFFAVDEDMAGEILAFVKKEIEPYVKERTFGFDTAFGIDERIEINEKREIFHIIRQGGNEITDAWPIRDVVKCEEMECGVQGNSLLNTVSENIDAVKGLLDTSDKISCMGVMLTIRTGQGEQKETVRFGKFSFPLWMSRTNEKYSRYQEEVSRFKDYLGNSCPECQIADLPVSEPECGPVGVQTESSDRGTEISGELDAIPEKDQFGVIKYVEGVARFIDTCTTPMTIAIQGSWGSGKNSILKTLFKRLEQRFRGNMIWCNARQMYQADSDEELFRSAGKKLISQLGGTGSVVQKERAVKVAKGLIKVATGIISSDSSAGQDLADGLFTDDASGSTDRFVRAFSEQVRKRITAGKDRVIFFIDGLDKLAPVKEAELLEALRNYFDCEGCVFVIAADYDSVICGAQEWQGRDFDENDGKNYFEKMFQISFRVPMSDQNICNYVKDKLEHASLYAGDEEELGLYTELLKHSVGTEPENMDRLFNSLLLIKNMAGEELYGSKNKRLMLFALLCMQKKFHDTYDIIVRMKDNMTPDSLTEIFSAQPSAFAELQLSGDRKAEFQVFAGILFDIISTNKDEGISEEDCRAFVEALDFSSITSK